MKSPQYEEEIEILPKLDGTFFAQVRWRGQTFQEELPRGIEKWSKDEFKAHLRRFVTPKLRLFVLKAQRAALEDGSAKPEDCLVTRHLTPEEANKIVAAEEKRKRRAERNLKLLH